jgi:hypothetical protein
MQQSARNESRLTVWGARKPPRLSAREASGLRSRLASRDDTPRRQQCKRCRRTDLASRAIVNFSTQAHAAKLVDAFSAGAGGP